MMNRESFKIDTTGTPKGLIIGKKGSTLRALQQEWNCTLEFNRRDRDDPMMVVRPGYGFKGEAWVREAFAAKFRGGRKPSKLKSSKAPLVDARLAVGNVEWVPLPNSERKFHSVILGGEVDERAPCIQFSELEELSAQISAHKPDPSRILKMEVRFGCVTFEPSPKLLQCQDVASLREVLAVRPFLVQNRFVTAVPACVQGEAFEGAHVDIVENTFSLSMRHQGKEMKIGVFYDEHGVLSLKSAFCNKKDLAKVDIICAGGPDIRISLASFERYPDRDEVERYVSGASLGEDGFFEPPCDESAWKITFQRRKNRTRYRIEDLVWDFTRIQSKGERAPDTATHELEVQSAALLQWNAQVHENHSTDMPAPTPNWEEILEEAMATVEGLEHIKRGRRE